MRTILAYFSHYKVTPSLLLSVIQDSERLLVLVKDTSYGTE